VPRFLRGALAGAGFGLAVAGVEAWIGARQIMQFHMPAMVSMLVTGAVMSVVLGALLGALLAALRRPVVHLLAVALVWAALEVYAAPDNPLFWAITLLGPLGAFLLVLLARRLGRGRPWAPPALGVALIAVAIVLPDLRNHLTAPAAPPRTTLPAAPPGAPDVVVVVLDTVRADHVSAYGYARPTTPSFDALARDAALFLQAISPGTWSLPSHASLFTGRFVSAHGAHDEHRFLSPGPPTLAESLAAAGYDTRCFTANAWISDALGLTRGFAWQDEAWRAGLAGRQFHAMYRLLDKLGFGASDKGGAGVAANFERWEASRPANDRPAFAFLNFIEAHFPYHQLPDGYLARFTTRSRAELRAASMTLFAAQFGAQVDDPAGLAPAATDMYDAGVLYADHLLGRVVDALRRHGSLERTIVVVLADHGEMLGEHGEFGHGNSVYEPVLRVPLLVRYPPRIATGARVAAPVSTVGVYATVLDLAGIAPPPSLQVGSLMPALAGQAAGGPVVAERFASMLGSAAGAHPADPLLRPDTRYRAYRAGTRKLVLTSSGAEHLFDLAADEHEVRNLAGTDPAAVARLRGELETWRAALGLPALDAPADGTAPPEIDPAAHDRLRALGYVQ